MTELWEITARVVRYGVPIGSPVKVLEQGCFAKALAQWWLPIAGTHGSSVYPPYAIAHAYRDREDHLEVDFMTSDWMLIDAALERTLEFSVDFACPQGTRRARPLDCDLYAVMAFLPPHQAGACPGTGVLGVRPVPELERVTLSLPSLPAKPPPATVRTQPRRLFGRLRSRRQPVPARNIGAEIRERWGVRRDDYDAAEFWVNQAAQRERPR